MSNKFYTKKGLLTAYALACGYVVETAVNNHRLGIYYESVYHVTSCNDTDGRIVWECFEKLGDARKFMSHCYTQIQNNKIEFFRNQQKLELRKVLKR